MRRREDDGQFLKLARPRAWDMAINREGTHKGVSAFLYFCNRQGWTYVEVVDWASPHGDWTFLVSKDGERWTFLNQVRDPEGQGFTHQIGTEILIGSAELVLRQVYDALDAPLTEDR